MFGGIEVFDGARPDDGRLDIGVITAKGPLQWTRAMARIGFGKASGSPFVSTTTARKIRMTFDRKVRTELDGGDRVKVKKVRIDVQPAAVTVCVPDDSDVLA